MDERHYYPRFDIEVKKLTKPKYYNLSKFSKFQLSKKKFFQESQYSLKIQTKRFHVTKPDVRGYNKFYEEHRSKTYLLDLSDRHSDDNDIHITLNPHAKHMNTHP